MKPGILGALITIATLLSFNFLTWNSMNIWTILILILASALETWDMLRARILLKRAHFESGLINVPIFCLVGYICAASLIGFANSEFHDYSLIILMIIIFGQTLLGYSLSKAGLR